jgi:hypothetical protein
MRLALAAAALLLAAAARPARAQTAADSAAIAATAHDYIDGWWTGDAARMARALHSHLAKRIVTSDSTGQHSRLGDMTAMELVQNVERGGGRSTPEAQRRSEVRILSIYRGAAVVRVDAGAWVDFLELARWNGEWKIVNVLWELSPR